MRLMHQRAASRRPPCALPACPVPLMPSPSGITRREPGPAGSHSGNNTVIAARAGIYCQGNRDELSSCDFDIVVAN